MTTRLLRLSAISAIAVLSSYVLLAPALFAQSTIPPAQQTTPPPVTAASPAAPSSQATPASAPAANTPTPASKYYEVPKGTQLPLALHNTVSTHSAHVGDQVYLETVFPIVINGRILIPAGSYVSGEITEVKRPGRIHGRGELGIKLNHLILPNAYDVNFNASPRDADTGGNETVDNEGKIKGDSDKAGDAGTVIRTTGSGALIGAIAARSGEGAGMGAGIGAAAGLAAVLLTRGPDAVLPRGTTLNVTLNRPLYLLADKINFTSLGQTPIVAGPPYHPARRSRIPFPLLYPF
jgi:hypothetical protein